MRAIVCGEPPRLPRVEVILEGASARDVVSIVGGIEHPGIALVGDIARNLDAAEYDSFCDAADKLSFPIEDMRCKRLARTALSTVPLFDLPHDLPKQQTRMSQ